MTNAKWQEGKTYRLKPDMIEEFASETGANSEIARLLGNEPFTVKTVNSAGDVMELVGFYRYDLHVGYWFDLHEIKFFELVSDNTQEIPMNNIRPEPAIVIEWLDKLQYVLQVDTTVGDNLVSTPSGMVLDADYGSIYGTESIYNFITNHYNLLQQEAKHKKNNELMERKAKLEAELAEVVASLKEIE